MARAAFDGVKIVVIGGGTGSFTLLSGLKHYTKNITALVSMADDGGSTGQLRDELGVLPPGDIRQCLVALSNNDKVRDLFNYRFEEGSLKGHSFGNLFLTALEKMSGSFADAVELAGEVLNIRGSVEPVTLTNVTLHVKDSEGRTVSGEHVISQTELPSKPLLWLEPEAVPNPDAVAAIMAADIVVIAPGDLYESIAPALIVPGISDALKKTKAKRLYICNLVTKPGRTDRFSVSDFANEIERLADGAILDYVLYNTDHPNESLLSKYAHEGEMVVSFDEDNLQKQHYSAKGLHLIAPARKRHNDSADQLAATRSFIRHNPDTVARAIMRIYFE